MSTGGDGVGQLRHLPILLHSQVLFGRVNIVLLHHLLALTLLLLLESRVVTCGVLRADGDEISNLHVSAGLGGVYRDLMGPFPFGNGLAKQEAGLF